MNTQVAPEVYFCLSSHCPHCPTMLQILTDLVKQGALSSLTIVNVETRPEIAREWGVRSVPWLKAGSFELSGLRSRDEIRVLLKRVASPTGMADYFHDLLRDGDLNQVLEMTRRQPDSLVALLPIVANPDASINVRIGAGAVFEEYSGQPPMRQLVEGLCELAGHADARVRADACHYLSLTGSDQGRACLNKCLQDDDGVVREIAAESLETLDVLPSEDTSS